VTWYYSSIPVSTLENILANSSFPVNKIIAKCKTIIANGPPGIFEQEIFRKATNEIIDSMVNATKNGALTIIGGGEMGAAAEMAGKSDDVSFISTAGGAMLEILSGNDLPMIKALREKKL